MGLQRWAMILSAFNYSITDFYRSKMQWLTRYHDCPCPSDNLGIEAWLRKARDAVLWPGMNGEIREAIAKCSVCAKFQVDNPIEPMQTPKVPDLPFSRLAVDMFTLHKKDYIVLMDYYSDFVKVQELSDSLTDHLSVSEGTI